MPPCLHAPVRRFEFCTDCGVPWHENSTCEQYRAWRDANAKGDEEFARLHKQLGSKFCPRCKNACVKQVSGQQRLSHVCML